MLLVTLYIDIIYFTLYSCVTYAMLNTNSVPRLYCVDCAVTTYFYFSLSLMGIMVLLLFNISEHCCWRAAVWLKFDVLVYVGS